jgi:hypothetical protein
MDTVVDPFPYFKKIDATEKSASKVEVPLSPVALNVC